MSLIDVVFVLGD